MVDDAVDLVDAVDDAVDLVDAVDDAVDLVDAVDDAVDLVDAVARAPRACTSVPYVGPWDLLPPGNPKSSTS